MQLIKCFTVQKSQITAGIKFAQIPSAQFDSDLSLYASLACYPLYPQKTFDSTTEDLMPLSVSFVYGYAQRGGYKNTISERGIILAIDAKQWTVANAQKDKSILLDPTGTKVLLYCPVGQTYLKGINPVRLLQVTAQCKPLITEMSLAKLQMTMMQAPFITPVLNLTEPQRVKEKLTQKACAKRPTSAPLEAVLDQVDETQTFSLEAD